MAQRTERSRFRIGELLVHPDRNVVVREGEDIRLEPMWMQILVYLAEHHGRTISTQELLDKPWNGMDRDEGAIQKVISLLRSKVFLEGSRKPRYIENIRGKGYRLIAPVAWPDDYLSSRGGGRDWKRGNPYVGLVAFDEAHADVFFGRGDAIARVVTAMRAQLDDGQRFVLLVGASGSGKTSLLNAGVIPKLTPSGGENGLRALSVARCDLGAATDGDALGALAVAIAGWKLGDRPVLPPQPVASLKEVLVESPGSIHTAIDEAFRRHPVRLDTEPHAHLLLVLDHSEALVATSDRDAAPEQQTTAKQALAGFVQALETLCDHPRVLATMIVRGDFYPKLMEAVPSLIERKGGFGHVDVARPTAIEINEIITLPAIAAGLEFERDPDTLAVHRLNDTLAEAARGQADVLPLLQHTLHELYLRCEAKKVLTYAAYREIGGLEGAIARRAEEVFASLPVDAQASLDAVLSQLVVIQPDTGLASKQSSPLKNLSEGALNLAKAFIKARLFTGESENGEIQHSLSHEALLRQWTRASDWIESNRRTLQSRQRLKNAASRWEREGRPVDLLLVGGIQLQEAEEVSNLMGESLDDTQKEFVRKSINQKRLLSIYKNIAGVILLVLSTTSLTFATTTFQAKKELSQRTTEAQKIADFMLTDLAEELRKKGDIGLLSAISQELLEYLEKRGIKELSWKERITMSKAFRTAGEAFLKIDDLENSEKSFFRSIESAKSALLSAKNVDSINELGQSLYYMGLYYYNQQKYNQAAAYWNGYVKTSEILSSLQEENPDRMMEKSYAINNMATIHFDRGEIAQAIFLYEKSAIFKEKAISRMTENSSSIESARKDLVDTLSRISSSQETIGKIDDAERGYERQENELKIIIGNRNDLHEWERQLANSMIRRAHALLLLGRCEEAEAVAHEAIEKLTSATRAVSVNMEWKRDLARAHMEMSDIHHCKGEEGQRNENLRIALIEVKKANKGDGINAEWTRLEQLISLRIYYFSDDPRKALEMIERIISELKLSAKIAPEDKSAWIALSNAMTIKGIVLEKNGSHEEAIRSFAESSDVIKDHENKSFDLRFEIQKASNDILIGKIREAILEIERVDSTGYKWKEIIAEYSIKKAHQIPIRFRNEKLHASN